MGLETFYDSYSKNCKRNLSNLSKSKNLLPLKYNVYMEGCSSITLRRNWLNTPQPKNDATYTRIFVTLTKNCGKLMIKPFITIKHYNELPSYLSHLPWILQQCVLTIIFIPTLVLQGSKQALYRVQFTPVSHDWLLFISENQKQNYLNHKKLKTSWISNPCSILSSCLVLLFCVLWMGLFICS